MTEKKKDLSDKPLEHILTECAILRGVHGSEHRTIFEFSGFVRDCIFSDREDLEKYVREFDLSMNCCKSWGLLFYDYCWDRYGDGASKYAEEESSQLEEE